MSIEKKIFIADDVLIKTGYVLIVIVMIAAVILWQFPADLKYLAVIGGIALGPLVPIVAAASILVPFVFLVSGYRIRAREKKIRTVWNILENMLEVSIDDLVENTGLEKETVMGALQKINHRGSAFFIYDRSTGLIFDGRLKSQTVAVDTCPACKLRLGYTIPLIVSKLPKCEYCGTELDATHINHLKQQKIQFITRSKQAPLLSEAPPRKKGNFSWPIFILLLVVAWPLALAYAFIKTGGKVRLRS
jgi:hypothetical protein